MIETTTISDKQILLEDLINRCNQTMYIYSALAIIKQCNDLNLIPFKQLLSRLDINTEKQLFQRCAEGMMRSAEAEEYSKIMKTSIISHSELKQFAQQILEDYF